MSRVLILVSDRTEQDLLRGCLGPHHQVLDGPHARAAEGTAGLPASRPECDLAVVDEAGMAWLDAQKPVGRFAPVLLVLDADRLAARDREPWAACCDDLMLRPLSVDEMRWRAERLLLSNEKRAQEREVAREMERPTGEHSRFELVSRAIRDGIWDWDLTTGIAWLSDVYYAMTGIPRDLAPSYETWLSLMHPDDRDRVVRTLEQSVAQGDTEWRCEYRIVMADGLWGTVSDRGIIAYGRDGRCLRMMGAISDVTEQRRAQDRQKLLAEASALLVGSLDCEANLEEVAARIVPLLADACLIDLLRTAPRSESQAAPVAEALLPLVALHAEPGLAGALCELQRRDGAAIPAAIQALVGAGPQRYDVAGAGRGAQALAGFIAAPSGAGPLAQLKMQSALVVPILLRDEPVGLLRLGRGPARRPLNDDDLELAQRLADRIAVAIDAARLYRQSREAVAARDEFLSIAAHELRTPLAALQGYAQLLLLEPDDAPARLPRCIEPMARQCERINRLVDRMLEISRLHVGQFLLQLREVALHELLAGVVERMQVGSRHPVGLICEQPVHLVADPDRIDQVVGNLVENAIKYSPAGTPVEVRLGLEQGSAVVSVADRGPGIPAAERETLFRRFRRSGRTGRRAGLGIGLWICQEIVRRHHGTIDFETDEAKGTVFRFRLPLRSPHEPARDLEPALHHRSHGR
jgi:signal transduction histidine kinase/PAS domain-containing protein